MAYHEVSANELSNEVCSLIGSASLFVGHLSSVIDSASDVFGNNPMLWLEVADLTSVLRLTRVVGKT